MLWVFLLFFAIGVLLAVVAHRRDWHRKYIDYRALAEGLARADLLAPRRA